MMRFLGVALMLNLIFTCHGAMAQQSDPVALTLDQALQMAMSSSPRIQALQAGTRAQESQAKSEENRWLGELMLNGGVALNGDDTLIRPMTSDLLASGVANMPFDDRYAFWSLAYRLPLFTGGTVSGSKDAARMKATAGRRNLGRSMLSIRHQVLKTYVNLLSLDAQIHAWQDELEALDSLVSHIELGQKAGKYSQVDLLKTQVQRQNVITRSQVLRRERITAYAALMNLLGEEDTTGRRFQLVALEPIDFPHTIETAEDLVDSALVRRSDLKALQALAAAQRFNASAVGGSRWPQVSLGGNFSGAHGGSIDFDDTFWSVNATVSLPLLDMGRRNNLARQADQTARSAELQVVDLQGTIRAEVLAALAAYEVSLGNIESQQATLRLAREINRIEKLRYDSGRGDIDNLLKSQSSQRTAEAALTEARHNLLIAWNNLQLTVEGECR